MPWRNSPSATTTEAPGQNKGRRQPNKQIKFKKENSSFTRPFRKYSLPSSSVSLSLSLSDICEPQPQIPVAPKPLSRMASFALWVWCYLSCPWRGWIQGLETVPKFKSKLRQNLASYMGPAEVALHRYQTGPRSKKSKNRENILISRSNQSSWDKRDTLSTTEHTLVLYVWWALFEKKTDWQLTGSNLTKWHGHKTTPLRPLPGPGKRSVNLRGQKLKPC